MESVHIATKKASTFWCKPMIDYATEIKERLDTAEVLEVYGIHIDRREVIRMCKAAQIILVTGAVIVAFFGVIGFGPNFKK